jgi:hypothetical protein
MAEIFTAFASEVKVNEETIEGLQSIEYSVLKNHQEVGAIGTDERIAVYFGIKNVAGKLRIASINSTLDGFLQANTSFTVSATLRNGDAKRSVAFDNCYLEDKSFGLGAEGHAETVYSFTATRVREE